MNDIVKRLREADRDSVQRVRGSRIFGDAADRIEALKAALGARGHTSVCVTRVRGDFPCDCGLDVALGTANDTGAEHDG